MRTLVMTAALLISATAQAQDKAAPLTPAKAPAEATKATDPLLEQKRQLSGELKSTLGTTDDLLVKVSTTLKTATGVDVEKYNKIASGLKEISSQLTGQLDAVNGATEANSKDIFGKAQETITASRKQLDGFQIDLGPETK